MSTDSISYEEATSSLPDKVSVTNARRKIHEHLNESKTTLIVMDDDPTGCQTVHDVEVLLSWEKPLIFEALAGNPNLIFIVTNTRSMPENRTNNLWKEILSNLKKVKKNY